MAHFRGWFAVCWMTLVGTLPASATVFTFYDGIAAGRALFDKTVRRAGASPTNDVWASAVPAYQNGSDRDTQSDQTMGLSYGR